MKCVHCGKREAWCNEECEVCYYRYGEDKDGK